MARNIQSQSARSEASLKAFVGLLANAVFWLIVAAVVPIDDIVGAFPELAPYAHWAPVAFYLLAFWSFLRAARVLQRLAAGKVAQVARAPAAPKTGRAPQRQATADRRPARTASGSTSGLPVSRTPTVQRMR